MNLRVDASRLWSELEQLATYSDTEPPSVTRIVYSDTDLEARKYVRQLCSDSGLETRYDALGNMFARWRGREPHLPAVATGSHIDAIPHAGRFDGTVGVLGGLEAIRALQRAGLEPKRSIELILFTSEEPTRFGIGCFGSRFLSGCLQPEAALQLVDQQGTSLDQARRQAGYDGPLENVALRKGTYSSFVELHIEQGPLLEKDGLPLGVVTAIAAPASLRVGIEGEGGHAGAVLMPRRHDAFLAAAELALEVETAAKSSGAEDTVATVGVCNVFPGAVNSIPSRVEIQIDIRDIVLERRDGVIRRVHEAGAEIAERRGVRCSISTINADAPAVCDPVLVEALGRACEAIPYRRVVSRAYHDSLFMARVAPVAMLFVRSRGGVSHRPDEYSSPDDIAAGAEVLARTLYTLAEL